MQSNLETHWLSHRYKSTHAEMNAEKSNKIKAVKKEKSNGNYPAVNSIAQMVQNGAPLGGYQKVSRKKFQLSKGVKNG